MVDIGHTRAALKQEMEIMCDQVQYQYLQIKSGVLAFVVLQQGALRKWKWLEEPCQSLIG